MWILILNTFLTLHASLAEIWRRSERINRIAKQPTMGQVVHGASGSWGELSMRRVVYGARASCPWGGLSIGQAVQEASCPWGELSKGELSMDKLSMGWAVMGRVVMWWVLMGRVLMGHFRWGELSGNPSFVQLIEHNCNFNASDEACCTPDPLTME
jgi:hypothetical protein